MNARPWSPVTDSPPVRFAGSRCDRTSRAQQCQKGGIPMREVGRSAATHSPPRSSEPGAGTVGQSGGAQ
jgi:hypothetical protein